MADIGICKRFDYYYDQHDTLQLQVRIKMNVNHELHCINDDLKWEQNICIHNGNQITIQYMFAYMLLQVNISIYFQIDGLYVYRIFIVWL